jgi:hypothetical protein
MSNDDTKTAKPSEMPLFWISDVTELNLLDVEDDKREKLAKFFATSRIRPPQEGGATYRFINYLTETGLLDDRRDTTGVGWRQFSFIEIVYINTVIALRKFGVKADAIKPIYNFFSKQYDPAKENHTIYGLMWLEVMVAIACGCEIELLVDSEGKVMILDPQYMSIFGTEATEGTLRISLSTMVNQARKQFGLSEIEMTSHFGKLPLSEAETSTILGMRDLREGQERINIKRTKDGKLHVGQEKIIDADDGNFAEKIAELMKDDFTEVQFVKRNGKVVNVRQTKSELFKN